MEDIRAYVVQQAKVHYKQVGAEAKESPTK
jgi:hypothetical protein